MVEGEDIACCSGKAPPEAKKVTICCDRLGDGVGMPPEAACSCTLTEFPRKLLKLGPRPFSAANTALTAWTIAGSRVGSWRLAATTGVETIENVWGAEFAAEASNKGPADDSACRRFSDHEFSPSKLAAKLLLVRRVVIVEAGTTNKNQGTNWHANSKLLKQHFAKNCKQATAYVSHEVPLLAALGRP